MRDQRVVPITWTPIVRASGGAMVETAVRVSVRFTGGGSGAGVRSVDEAWEPTYANLLVNYGQGRSWRRRGIPSSRGSA